MARVRLFLVAAACFAGGCGKPPAAVPPVPPTTVATVPVPTTAPAGLARLTVTVTDLRDRNGDLIFGVFTSADGFPNVAAKAVNWQVKAVTADSVVFTADLPPGAYGASVLHDENRSGDMDRGFAGVPKEGYGVTNNPKPRLRAATFQEATFTLPPEGADLTISLQYF